MLLGTALTVACTDTLVTLAKGWLCWDDERAVQEFFNGYICLECYRTVSKYSSSESYLKSELLRRNTDLKVVEIREKLSEVNRQLKLLLHNPAMRRHTPCLTPYK
ncbi:hypothetical protein EMCRGX_G018073 [Ephydatia muelleri]